MSMKGLCFILLCFLLSSSIIHLSNAADTITPMQSFVFGNTLVSSGQSFEMGFFSPAPGNPKYHYIGIWYKNSPRSIVWVANRENPVTDSYGVLMITHDGKLVLLDGANNTIWSSKSFKVAEDPIVQLLESGNLVVRDKTDENTENYIWKSFDFPCDTLLPDMKMGWNLSTGVNRYLVSWKNASDPSPGDITYRIDIDGLPQIVLRNGTQKKFRSGPWNGHDFSGIPLLQNSVFKPIFVYNTEELYYTYQSEKSNSIITRMTVNHAGSLDRLVLNEETTEWTVMYTVQNDRCDDYGRCGANGVCRINKSPICECLMGFTPKSQEEWDVNNFSSGCVKRLPLDCPEGEDFVLLKGVKPPDFLNYHVDKSLNINKCKAECLKNCSCTAYANSDISGCLIWFGNLIDIREITSQVRKEDIYIRVPASEREINSNFKEKKRRVVIIVLVSTATGMVILGLARWYTIWKTRRKKRDIETKNDDLQLPIFSLRTISTATNNFSYMNVIGEGGFGRVYKGELPTGQVIAVKSLSKNSGQGHEEFKNEVMLIAKLQHRNLVKLWGCCIEGEERMLIYEYMPNKSLDTFIFDKNRRTLIDWEKRFDIITGIGRGLLYLHQDSRLRIIHRDLKTSNILLDSDLNPKISDFGLARIFGGDQVVAKTKRVVGTYGYISPEYAFYGNFSAKSDVFSFGVVLLEIVSGKRNRAFCHSDHHHSLLGHAWLLWSEDSTLKLMDPCLAESYVEPQVLRCIQVGLLCVQKFAHDRPAMSSVVFMLSNEEATLPQPKQPGFFIESQRSSTDMDASTNEERHLTANAGLTITMMEAR